MAVGSRGFFGCGLLLLLFFLQVPCFSQQFKSIQPQKNVAIMVTYVDASGDVRVHKVNSKDLSASWVWESPDDNTKSQQQNASPSVEEIPFQKHSSGSEYLHQAFTAKQQHENHVSPEKHRRQQLRKQRVERRAIELNNLSEASEYQMQVEAIERSKEFNDTIRENYSFWRREHKRLEPDHLLKLMKDQIILAKVYASIARAEKKKNLSNTLTASIELSERTIGEANSDAELHEGAFGQLNAMGSILTASKNEIYDCTVVSRKLRAMLQSREESITALKKKDTFLTQLATKSIPKSLYCISLQLANDYFLNLDYNIVEEDKQMIEDLTLYHYAIFSDNVLATSVAVNSTVVNAIDPERHVFHVVTDNINFVAMKKWFTIHPPWPAMIHIENVDEITWLNSSYCPVLRQLESEYMRDYYFKVKQPGSLAAGDEQLRFRNPKYLSMLNHLRFYIPELYPKLDKVLFLDDDVVVQRDLTSLWSIDMKGKVNGAVETCRGKFHLYSSYLNFSNPIISKNFDPKACAWAFGMNIFDLKEWRRREVTQRYHYWQDLNKDRTLWKLGSLPPGLMAFYDLTHVIDPSWHLLKLGYDSSINPSTIENAAVIHFNGNYKPWLDHAILKYKGYWTKYLKIDSSYLRRCHFNL